MTHRRITRLATATLLGGASLLTLGATAHAQSVLFSTSSEIASGTKLDTGREVSVASGTVQVRLPGGAIASFVDSAQFSLRDDGSVDLRAGSVTIVGVSGATTAVHMPEGVRGSVAGTSAATFTANATGSRGSTTVGTVSVLSNGVTKSFVAGQFWMAGANRSPDRVIAGSAVAVPGARDVGPVRPMQEGGVVAAAENGIPVALGEGLAGVGARGDIVAAARRIEAYDANPTIAAFPTGDYALLVSYAAQADGLLGTGSTSFNGAGADIIRTYFQYLAAGNAGPNFRTAYAQVLLNYLDLLRSGVLPSTFRGATQSQLTAYLAFIGRTEGFGSLSASNRQLLDAYLAFLSSNGSPDAFGVSVTNLTTSFLNYVRAGNTPASFTQASASVVAQYLAIVNSGGLKTNLTAQNQALLTAYLANNGIGFTTSYATGLAAFVAYLNTGGLPSGYTALPAATVRQYLETLETTGLFDSVLGTQSAFLRSYLVFLRGGGTADQFNALPINIARVNASNLNIYVEYLLAGGAPTAYTALTQAQIRAALDQLTATGQFNALLGINAAFLGEYYAYIRTGADADTFAGLPSVDVNAYAASLQLFAAYLRAGNLPSGYATLSAQQIRSYLTALQVSGKLTLLGSNATLLGDYLTYIRTGGAPDAFGGLPIVTYQSYATALTAYFAYLNAGGLPSGYTALTQAQLRSYLDVLQANGQFVLLGTNATFYTNYLTYLAGGGAVDAFGGLPIVTFQGYATALTAYFAYLNAGGLPSGYTVLSQAQVRQYLDALAANAQLTALLGSNAAFFTQYRAYLLTGASVDAFAGLPIVTYQSYAVALNAYYAFLVGGGTPGAYTALSQAQIRTYLDTLKAAGQVNALLGANSAFFTQYLAFLETGGSANNYPGLPSSTYGQYATALTSYFAYLNGGGLPSGYTALTQAQIREYLSVLQANNQLTALLGVNATFFANYLTFVSGGGSADAFTGLPIVTYNSYASALTAYYTFLAGGGLPANYTALSQAQIRQYLDALQAAGQLTALLGGNATFFANYLTYVAGGGVPNNFPGLPSTTYGSYATALTAYFAYLNGGGLPSGYTALTQAQIREYLSVLQTNNQLNALLGVNATFFANYLTFVSGGGSADAFTGLPIVTYNSYASALTAYYAYLAGGGLPAGYTVLTQAQIRQYLDALAAANQITALLGQNAAFFTSYQVYLAGGGAPDQFAGLPSMTYAQYGTSLQAFVAFLRGNGLPGGYTALTSAQIREYLAVLQANGQLGLIGSTADQQLLTAYATYLAGGGLPNQFAGLPAFVTYEASLRTYYAFLQGGGKPSAYTALTQAQIVAYIQALDAAGLIAAKLTAAEATFLRDYAVYVSAGSNPDQFAGLPGNMPTPTPVVTQGFANVPLSNVITAASGKGIASPASRGTAQVSGSTVTGLVGAVTYAGLTATTAEARSVDGAVAIARVGNGNFRSDTTTQTLTGTQGTHLIWGAQATAVPTTGSAIFGMVTATSPTRDDGTTAPGVFTGNLGVDFASLRVGWDSVIGIGGTNYRFASAGGTAAPSIAIGALSTFAGAASTANNGLAGTGSGFLAGTGGALAGFSYVATTPGANGDVHGVAVFGKGQAAATLPTVTPAPTTPVVAQGLADAPRSPVASGAVGKAFVAPVNVTGSVTVSGNNLTAFNGAGIATAMDTASVEARTVDGTIALVRWGSGTWRGETGGTRTILANESLHFVWGTPATALPTTGVATFGLVTATSPTLEGGTLPPGTFVGNLGVDFATKRIGLDSRITIGGVVYGFATAGGTTAPSLALGISSTFNGVAATTNFPNSDSALINGFLSGTGGAYAGLIYSAILPVGTVDGSAIFGRNQAAATLPTATYTGTPSVTNLPAPTYAYAAGLGTNSLYVRSTYPTATGSGLTIQTGASVTRDSAGGLLSSSNASTQDITRLTASAKDVFGDARAVIGRWTDGTYRVGPTNNASSTLSATQSLHYVQMATPSFALPTSGQINYALLAATQPTYNTGATGAGLFDGKMALLFGSAVKVALEGTIRMPEATGTVTYAFATPGGVAGVAGLAAQTFSNNVIAVTAPLTGSGLACTTNCVLNFSGGFAGTADFNRIGAVYYTSDSRSSAPSIEGAAIFTGTAAPAPGVTTLANQRVAFVSAQNSNTGPAPTVELNAAGTIQRVVFQNGPTSTFDYTLGTQNAVDSGKVDTVMAWTRWGGGASGSVDGQSFHVVAGTPATALPASGTVTYNLIGSTRPTDEIQRGTPGTITGSAAVLFGAAPKVGLDLNVAVSGKEWKIGTTGGLTNMSQSELTLSTATMGFQAAAVRLTGVSGGACSGFCNAYVGGALYGAGASNMGLTYVIQQGSGSGQNYVTGSAAFAAAPATGGGSGFTGTLSNQVTYAYAGGSLVDQGITTATYENGVVKSYVSFLDGKTKSAGLVQESGRLADTIGWARWTGDTAGPLTNQGPNAGVHVMSGAITAVSTLPASGTVQYAMVGGTKTTLGTGSATPGSLTGTLAIAFGSLPKIGFDLTASVGNYGWNVKTVGGSANPTTSTITLGSSATFSGQFNTNVGTVTATTADSCRSGCAVTVGGQLFGAGASHVGVAFNVLDTGPAGVTQASAIGIFAKAP